MTARLDALFAAAATEVARGRFRVGRARSSVAELADTLDHDLDELLAIAERGRPALVVTRSANRKLAPVDLVDVGGDRPRPVPRGPFVDATYVPVAQTCPASCPFRGHGCMAEAGYTGRAVRRLEALAEGLSERAVTHAEALAIDGTHRAGVARDGGRDGRSPRDMRLHVSGDVGSRAGLGELVGAIERWHRRGGGVAWTFTHRWRELHAQAWGPISVLASVEEPGDGVRARARGYAPAITVRDFPSGRAFSAGGTTWVPCPAETSGRTCVECRLCLDHAQRLRDSGRGIAFAVHGPGEGAARRRLPVLRGAA